MSQLECDADRQTFHATICAHATVIIFQSIYLEIMSNINQESEFMSNGAKVKIWIVSKKICKKKSQSYRYRYFWTNMEA